MFDKGSRKVSDAKKKCPQRRRLTVDSVESRPRMLSEQPYSY